MLVMLPAQGAKPRGESSTLNISECPNDVVESTLLQVLVTDSIPQKYFLSAAACQGILRRAHARNKPLPPALKAALERTCQTETQASHEKDL